MQRSISRLPLLSYPSSSRCFCSKPQSDKIVAAVLLERSPVVVPKIEPIVYAFQEFSFRWRNQYRKEYPDDVLGRADTGESVNYQDDYVPAPRITEADKTNDRRSLQRALDRRLYLLLYGTTFENESKPTWHFPEKIYEDEETLRKCAETALLSVVGNLTPTYFVGNAPFAHMSVQPTESKDDVPSFKRFFFKSQVVDSNECHVSECEDHVWVTKDELMEYFPDQSEFLKKMIIS